MGMKKKISVGRGATINVYRVSCGRHRCADGILRPTTFYLGAVKDTTEQVADSKRAIIRAEWKQLQVGGADEWTDEAVVRLADRGIVSRQVANRKIADGIDRSLVLPDDALSQRRVNAQRAELRHLRDGNGSVRPESFPLYVFTLTKQVLTEPDCEARLRSDLRELAMSQPREAVRFASDLYRLLGKPEGKDAQTPVSLNITYTGPASEPTGTTITMITPAEQASVEAQPTAGGDRA